MYLYMAKRNRATMFLANHASRSSFASKKNIHGHRQSYILLDAERNRSKIAFCWFVLYMHALEKQQSLSMAFYKLKHVTSTYIVTGIQPMTPTPPPNPPKSKHPRGERKTERELTTIIQERSYVDVINTNARTSIKRNKKNEN